MTVERSYRIDRHSPTSPDTYGVTEFEEGQPYTHVGVLVPDTRLQAIADAWNGESMELRIARTELYETWPELARVIDLAIGEGLPDALTEEKS